MSLVGPRILLVPKQLACEVFTKSALQCCPSVLPFYGAETPNHLQESRHVEGTPSRAQLASKSFNRPWYSTQMKRSLSTLAMRLSIMALDNDPYYAQLLLDRSDALLLTDKDSIDSDVRVDCLRSQSKENNGTS